MQLFIYSLAAVLLPFCWLYLFPPLQPLWQENKQGSGRALYQKYINTFCGVQDVEKHLQKLYITAMQFPSGTKNTCFRFALKSQYRHSNVLHKQDGHAFFFFGLNFTDRCLRKTDLYDIVRLIFFLNSLIYLVFSEALNTCLLSTVLGDFSSSRGKTSNRKTKKTGRKS